jgi:hypothetical protein
MDTALPTVESNAAHPPPLAVAVSFQSCSQVDNRDLPCLDSGTVKITSYGCNLMSEIIKIEVADKAVSVPIDKKTLGEFISGLLGQPQILERHIDSAFSIDHPWLIHFCALILQRIQQQNAPEPLAFEATVSYQDGVVRTVTSLPAFEHFSETQNIISTGVEINIALLIQFPSKQAPERQELVVYFDTNNAERSLIESLVGRAPSVGRISIGIRHTERTWADDLLRLIEAEVKGVQIAEMRLKKWLRKAFLPFVSLLFPMSMVFGIVSSEWLNRKSGGDLAARIAELLSRQDEDPHLLHEKVNLLLSNAVSSSERAFGSAMSVASSFCIALIIFVAGLFLARPIPSFVVLSKAAEKHKIETMEKLKRKNLVLLLSMIGSIALGVLGNFLYDKIK